MTIPQDWRRGYLCIYGAFRGGKGRWLAMHEARDRIQRARLEAALAQVDRQAKGAPR